MGVKVSFLEAGRAADAPARIEVPKSAVKGSRAQSFVWALRDGTVHRTPVIRVLDTEAGIEISAGLRGGERVVTAAPGELHDGERVNPGQ